MSPMQSITAVIALAVAILFTLLYVENLAFMFHKKEDLYPNKRAQVLVIATLAWTVFGACFLI